jgi:putative acetyltransferase
LQKGEVHFSLPMLVRHRSAAVLFARLNVDTAEIKRMYVTPDARGRGVGRAILMALEAESRRLNIRRIVLETGERQPEALALYTKAGYDRIPLFGEYIGSRLSVCMAKAFTT